MTKLTSTTTAALLAVSIATPTAAQQISTFNGPCDASAAVALDASHFIVANDENNTLRIYRQGQPAPVVKHFKGRKHVTSRGFSSASLKPSLRRLIAGR